MKASNNNVLRRGALFSLFVTSYIPLFAIVIGKQVKEGWAYMRWGGWSMDAFCCFATHFGMSCLLAILSVVGLLGINNRNSEAIGYIATYIVPFMASDFSSWYECLVFAVVMGLIYVIYTNSNMILINPLLNIKYSLLDVEYKLIGDSVGNVHDALIITETKDYRENENYQIYQIGFKLYYGKERE